MRQQFIVAIQDLRFVTILCRRCNTRVTMDFQTEFTQPRVTAFLSPRECPVCHTPFDSAIAPAIEAMQKVYKTLGDLGSAVSFTSGEAAPEE